MGRTYAGILGPISFGTVIARNLIDGGSVESAMIFASVALFVFAAIGFVIGTIAERIVVEAITTKFQTAYRCTKHPMPLRNQPTIDPSDDDRSLFQVSRDSGAAGRSIHPN